MENRIDHIKIAVLIPALNEELSIKKIITKIPIKKAQIIVVDNGSTDNTAKIAKSCGVTVVHEPRRGYGSACLAGIRYLKTIKPEIVIFLDADGADDPMNIIRFLEFKINNPSINLVMGNRLNNLIAGAMSPHSIIANKILTKLIEFLFRVKINDMGPLRVIDYNALIDLNMKDKGFGWSSEMIVKILKKGYRIAELDVIYKPRIGESKISGSLKNSLQAAIWLTIHIFRIYLLGD